MSKNIFWSDEAKLEEPYKGGMYVRSDLGQSFKKWTDAGIKIVGISVDDSREVEFIIAPTKQELKEFKGEEE